MAVDVLTYNAMNCRTQLLVDPINQFNRTNLFRCSADTTLWNSILPMCITSGGTVLNVCDTSGLYRCGACCLWTVPAGVTRAQFQLWGAGAGSGGGMCCGFSLPGATGAYAIVTIPVTAGCQYTICAGCAFCCYDSGPNASGCNITDGCASFVTGYGLSNFCAEGARAGHCQFSCNWGSSKYTLNPVLPISSVISNVTDTLCMCYCGAGSTICTGSSKVLPFTGVLPSDRTFWGNTSTSGINVCGLPSMTAGFYRDTNLYGYNIVPPVVTPCCATAHVTDSCYTGTCWCCQIVNNGNSCGGHCCGTTQSTYTKYFLWPGQGGVGVTYMGGNCWCGDSGRMGMVKVTYC